MNLMMYIGNDLIEAVRLEENKLRIPGYIGDHKRYLKEKYQQLISQHSKPPDFLVTKFASHPGSSENDKSN